MAVSYTIATYSTSIYVLLLASRFSLVFCSCFAWVLQNTDQENRKGTFLLPSAPPKGQDALTEVT